MIHLPTPSRKIGAVLQEEKWLFLSARKKTKDFENRVQHERSKRRQDAMLLFIGPSPSGPGYV